MKEILRDIVLDIENIRKLSVNVEILPKNIAASPSGETRLQKIEEIGIEIQSISHKIKRELENMAKE